MMGFLVRPLDRIAIRGAMSSVTVVDGCGNIDAAEKVLREPDLFGGGSEPARDLTFQSEHEFQFTSPGDNPWPENKIVHGKFYRAGKQWQTRPTVILLHGWNGELGYWRQFPYLAWRLNRHGLNAAMFELPYHAQRKPTASDRSFAPRATRLHVRSAAASTSGRSCKRALNRTNSRPVRKA